MTIKKLYLDEFYNIITVEGGNSMLDNLVIRGVGLSASADAKQNTDELVKRWNAYDANQESLKKLRGAIFNVNNDNIDLSKEIADQNRKIEDKAKLIKGVDKANSQMAQEIAELKCLVDFDTKAILKDSDTIDAQQQQIECLKKQVSQLKAENISMAAYADQRINMLTRANKKLGGES